MAEYLTAVWGAALLSQTALLFGQLRSPIRRPCFTRFIAADLVRWGLMLAIWLYGTRTQYGYAFLVTEPVSMILLACVGIETFGRYVNERPPPLAYIVMVVSILLVGMVLPTHDLQTRSTPTLCEILLNKMFMQRALFALLTVSMLLVAFTWHKHRPEVHAVILFCFCLFDLVTYLSLTLYPVWARTRPLDGPLFVMVGQTGCLLAWLYQLVREKEA